MALKLQNQQTTPTAGTPGAQGTPPPLPQTDIGGTTNNELASSQGQPDTQIEDTEFEVTYEQAGTPALIQARNILETVQKLSTVQPVSDLHVKGSFVRLHTHKGVETLHQFGRISQDVVKELLHILYNSQTSINKSFTTDQIIQELQVRKVLDFSAQGGTLRDIKQGRMRVQAYYDATGIGITCRLLQDDIPKLTMLGFNPDHSNLMKTIANKKSGLILVTGATGHGKSTTLAAIIEHIRIHEQKHIVTVEDPIEFHYKDNVPGNPDTPSSGFVTQQEIGKHVKSYHQGLTDALRKHPDIILIGEVRDAETMETCLHAAQTGHLVFTTLHTRSASRTLDRILEMFPQEKEKSICGMLAENMLLVVCQGLLKRADGKGKALCYELMDCDTEGVRPAIRKYRESSGIKEILIRDGNMEWDKCLDTLKRSNVISPEVAESSRIEAVSSTKPV